MRWGRLVTALLLALSFSASPAGGPAEPAAEASPLRQVEGDSVSALVPPSWRARALSPGAAGPRGLQAAGDLRRWGSPRRSTGGLEAYWIDATTIGVPSDYYYLAAEGPAMSRLPGGRNCRRIRHEVLRDSKPRFDRRAESSGDYVATAGGMCRGRGRSSVWAAFVAAPGFGPVRAMGIPESGLYVAVVMVPDGPRAEDRAERLLSTVSFGGTRVSDFIAAARGRR